MIALLSLALGLASSYTSPGYENFSPDQKFRPVGVFADYGNGEKLEKRTDAGLLTMTLQNDAPANSLIWTSLNEGKDLLLGKAFVPGSLKDKGFSQVDWATTRFDFTTKEDGKEYTTHVYGSRACPAVLYSTQAPKWSWTRGDLDFDHAAYRTSSGRVETVVPNRSIGALGAPWVIVWKAKSQVAPFLIRFEHKPKRLNFTGDLNAEFDGQAGSVEVMPLYGIRRIAGLEAGKWTTKLPQSALSHIEFWNSALAAYPIKVDETYKLNPKRPVVTVKNQFEYLTIQDAWGTKPLRLAPVPPITAMAESNGYPVKWQRSVHRTEVSTFLGPFTYCQGTTSGYTIPLPSARDNTLSPLQVNHKSEKIGPLQDLNHDLQAFAIKPDDTSDGGLNLELKELSQAYPLASPETQSLIRPKMAEAIKASYSPSNLSTITEPGSGQRYLMCNKIWCADQPYDREWYTGRQLDATCEYASYVDPSVAAKYWPQIQGLYSYFRIYSDWAWSGTSSSVFGYALCGDGMNFAMEGMLGVARMAKRVGDEDTWKDASYRAAKEATCTFASFSMAKYSQDVNYATWTDTSYDYETKKGRYRSRTMDPAKVETGFGIDIYTDKTGIKELRPGMFWHAISAIYWNNSSLDRLYDEFLYAPVHKWLFQTMPKQHPNWTNKDAMEKFDNTPYGSNLTLAVLSARAVICGESQESQRELSSNLLTDIAPLYTLRHKTDLVEADAPQVWLPMDSAEYQSATWDAAAHKLTIVLKGLSDGEANFDWAWRQNGITQTSPNPGPTPRSATLNHKELSPKQIAGGFWRVPLHLKKGQMETVTVYLAS